MGYAPTPLLYSAINQSLATVSRWSPILLFIFVVIFTSLSPYSILFTLHKNNIFIIEIGYNAQQISQPNITSSLSKAHGYMPYLLFQKFLQIKAKMCAWHDQICLTLYQLGYHRPESWDPCTRLVPSTPQGSQNTVAHGCKKRDYSKSPFEHSLKVYGWFEQS